ncbi:MAG TPA: hypothetical protein VGC85_02045 [Chthoniobacterales bacterium]
MNERSQRASVRRRGTPSGRVKVAPYVVPTRRPPKGNVIPSAMTVPTRYVKFVIALFLLPICAILTQTFFTVFTRAAMTQQLWAAEEFWFFSLGAVLWLIAFFGLPRPLLVYVFGHELTHALWVWLMGGRVSKFKVGREGGHIITDRNNFWISLAPYFFPLYSIIVIAIYGALSFAFNMQPYGRVLYALIGITWAFHFTFTLWMIPKSQTDLTQNGTFFSLVLIYFMNLLLISVLLVLASPQITFAGFAAEMGENISRFFGWIDVLQDRFVRGYRPVR